MTQPSPLAAFDIWPDGAARPAPDATPTPSPGAARRWLHFDLRDPALRESSESQLPLATALAMALLLRLMRWF